MSSHQWFWLLLCPGCLKSRAPDVLQGNLLSESGGEMARCVGACRVSPGDMRHCDPLHLFFSVFTFSWFMWFNLSSFNLHTWIISSKASICLNFGLFFKHLFSVKGNQGYTYLVLHYLFPGLLIKPFLKKVRLIQRRLRRFCRLWSRCCCLTFSADFAQQRCAPPWFLLVPPFPAAGFSSWLFCSSRCL